MPQEKPAFFVEFFRYPLTEAYPEVFQPLGDGIELTRWWLGHDDPRRCSLFSLFAIRHENRWGLDAEGILAVSSERPRRRTVVGRRGGRSCSERWDCSSGPLSLADSPSCLPVTASPRFFDRLDPGIRKLAMITHVVEGDVKQDLSVFLNFCLFALLFRARRNRRRRNAWR